MTIMNRGAVEWSRKVVWTWSKRFWKGLGHAFQKIYTLWGLSLVGFCENGKTQIFSNIKHLKNNMNLDLKMTSKKGILKTSRSYIYHFWPQNTRFSLMLWQCKFFLTTRDLDRCVLDDFKPSHKLFRAGNRMICDFFKKLRGKVSECLEKSPLWNEFEIELILLDWWYPQICSTNHIWLKT